ncbi:ABC transporter ATP-binding protein [Bradyrhizobium sp. U87765 SZCCT0131]|uniref:ABC transporter ATP-binding protein n=1 Tax=unclassified Bradyrhizobium TaxID=2631580 RepID=UPI001BA470A1|nr:MULTISPECIES: ABC transporter ATP-binding protein [unclassified Bradyrhizobium]MBR1217704.1 ABC transporter ATP-binding protein [Bradyrhizobium sp. U87765 SZCCT0131]MBR1261350.1 ABC transporter ATP-binding protein [Bradyrhizobium sp. U87765 SZCCT0134]MBR1303202.1 ABC transporter ATP-binding protein [Bradyrhizobium sp. U87765 SZCCT0110]MBR1318808.1 ABC transporter ATP-binding protein [Bradyrhizobium sp. U87765 SZCCT0109]MBR1347133.1 ABC transporter ATP-binding protein [Bradyrhizobium sp. U87
MSKLEVSAVCVDRSHLPVVRDVNLTVESGKISVLLGANGAGKTTLLEGLSGVIPIASGRIAVDGHDVQRARPGERVRAGLAHVEQGRTVFRQLTTDENLRAGARSADALEEAYELFPELRPRRQIKAGLLSGGEQQMLVIARALVGRPKILLVDEMSAGLAPVIVRRLMTTVRQLADQGLAVVLVEQFAELALAIGDRAYVLRRGQMVYDGSCNELREAPDRLHQLYLGAATSHAA